MKRTIRLAAPMLLVLGLFGANAADVTIAPPTAWPKTDVPADPAITLGTLPNGMRYLIQHNVHPEHGVSFFLRIATGSFDENEKTAGISHFIEHMAFRGTAHIPDGEAIKRLAKIGVGLGTDSNAFTMADSTVFTFDFPGNDESTVETALTLTRDIASEIQFDAKAVDSERQVVLSEYRLRDTPQLHLSRISHAAMFGDRLAEAYMPIGREAAIQGASADDLKNFYRTYYRPERTTLIVIGDIDAKALEAKIKERFAGWKATTPKPAALKFTYPDPHKTASVKVVVEPGINTAVQMTWVSPFDGTPETKARDTRDTIRDLALRALNLRLHAQATSADPPFLGAGAGASNSYRTAFVASLGASVGSGDAKRALKALHQTLVTILRDGITQEEVDQAVTQNRSNIEASVAAAASRKSNQLTGTYSSAIGKDDVIDGPENWLPTFEAAVKGLTAARATAELRALFGKDEPLIIVTSAKPIDGGAEAFEAAYNEAVAPAAAPVASAKPVVWPYTDFGPAGSVATQKTIDDLGATAVIFANNVRATIKPTKFQDGQVQILVRIGHGRYALPRDPKTPIWALAGTWALGGVNRIATADLPKALNGKQWGARPEIGESALQVAAQTRPADLETNLQFVTAFITDPAWRPEGLAQIRSATETGIEQALITPSGVYGMNLWYYLHNNDARWRSPTVENVKATNLADIKALLEGDLKDASIDVTIVGDVTVEAAIEALKRTVAALPKRTLDTKPYLAREDMPKTGGAPTILRHHGTSHEAIAMLGWKTTSLFPDVQNVRALRVLESVMRTRLFDELRTKEGITYTPQTTLANSWTTPGWGVLTVTASVPADKLAAFYAAAKSVAADLAAKELTADEFERAREPLVKDAEHSMQNNNYWLYSLGGSQVDPRALTMIRERISGLKAVTAADVQKVAQKYLRDERTLRLIVAPEGYAVPEKLP